MNNEKNKENENYKISEIVWAKLGNDPFWPGAINKISSNEFQIFFFGQDTKANINQTNIKKWNESFFECTKDLNLNEPNIKELIFSIACALDAERGNLTMKKQPKFLKNIKQEKKIKMINNVIEYINFLRKENENKNNLINENENFIGKKRNKNDEKISNINSLIINNLNNISNNTKEITENINEINYKFNNINKRLCAQEIKILNKSKNLTEKCLISYNELFKNIFEELNENGFYIKYNYNINDDSSNINNNNEINFANNICEIFDKILKYNNINNDNEFNEKYLTLYNLFISLINLTFGIDYIYNNIDKNYSLESFINNIINKKFTIGKKTYDFNIEENLIKKLSNNNKKKIFINNLNNLLYNIFYYYNKSDIYTLCLILEKICNTHNKENKKGNYEKNIQLLLLNIKNIINNNSDNKFINEEIENIYLLD